MLIKEIDPASEQILLAEASRFYADMEAVCKALQQGSLKQRCFWSNNVRQAQKLESVGRLAEGRGGA